MRICSGIEQANKVMHIAVNAYNLKKYLKFIQKTANTSKQRLAFCLNQINHFILAIISTFKPLKNPEIKMSRKAYF